MKPVWATDQWTFTTPKGGRNATLTTLWATLVHVYYLMMFDYPHWLWLKATIPWLNRITGVPSTRFMWWRVSYLKTNTSVNIRPLVLWSTLPSLRYTGYLPRINRIHTRISAMLRAIPQKKGIFNGAARQQGWGDSYVVEVSGDPWTSR